MKVLVTGITGFIGYHLAQRLLAENISVYGIDNLNDYYEVSLKKDRLVSAPTASWIYFSVTQPS